MWVRTYTHFSRGGRPPAAADHPAKNRVIDQLRDDASSFIPRAAARLRRAALPEAPVPAEASRRGSRQNASLRFERLLVGGDRSGCSLGQSIAATNQEGQDAFFARFQYDLSPLIRSKASLATMTLALARERQPAKPSSSDFPMRSGVLMPGESHD